VSNLTTFSFPEEYTFAERSIKLVKGLVGIYFIYLADTSIEYPFGRSRLIYIGMSESKQNSIGNRLRDHLTGQSGNCGLMNYAAKHRVRFTYQSFDLLQVLGSSDLYELESLFLTEFLNKFGCFPICNGQSGVTVLSPAIDPARVKILWETFDSQDSIRP
jgi:hypothetical protein